MRKFAGTLAALAVLVVLGAYILFVEGVRPPDKDADKVLVNVPADDVTRVAIEQASGRVEIARNADEGDATGDGGGKWEIAYPRRLAASKAAVDALVDAARNLKCEKKVTASAGADDLDAFGLASPWLKVTLDTKQGGKTLLVGAETPVGGARYARLADGDPVYILASSTVSALAKTLDDLRERQILGVSSDSVTALRLVAPGGQDIRLEKKGEGEGEWRIVHPFDDVADRWKVSDLVWDLTGLSVSKFVDDEGKDLARWGLDRPRLRVDAHSSERSSPFELFVGAPGPDGKGFYARTSDSPSVYLASPAAFSPLETGVFDLVKKDLLSWDDDDLLRVTCVDQGKAVAFLKEGKEWKAVHPDLGTGAAAGILPRGTPAPQAPEVVKEGEKWQLKTGEKRYSSEDMGKLLSAVRDVTVAMVVQGAVAGADDARYGLDRPRVRVELDLGDGKVLELKVGAGAGARGGGGHYATATGRGLVYVVEEKKVQALESAIQALG
ncbi:MAG: DUF4340 domain-containing protein [Bacillota bacterium]|nr:DUF4340 domain-containing protein [Bacillota bacterium]